MKFVFVVGCGHSGTSILTRILGNHHNIYAIPRETGMFFAKEKNILQKISKYKQKAEELNKQFIVEKTPKHLYKIDDIIRIIPDAKILFIVRDGRDVTYSIMNRYKDKKDGINIGMKRWLNDNEEGWKYSGKPYIKFFKYEKLVTDFINKITDILKFIGEEYDPNMLEYYKTPVKWYSGIPIKGDISLLEHNKLRDDQINKPLYNGSGCYLKFSKHQVDLVETKLDSMLRRFGYK